MYAIKNSFYCEPVVTSPLKIRSLSTTRVVTSPEFSITDRKENRVRCFENSISVKHCFFLSSWCKTEPTVNVFCSQFCQLIAILEILAELVGVSPLSEQINCGRDNWGRS